MKTLYLIRHAKSSWKNSGLDDFDRPLNDRGKRDAPFMGSFMKQQGILPDIILTSPAKRAFTTAKKIAKETDYSNQDIVKLPSLYLSNSKTIHKLVNDIDDRHSTVFLFGHNPGLTEFVNYISGHYIDNIPTTGIVRVDFEINSWKEITAGSGIFKAFYYPKQFAELQ